ncbi:conserved exported hypothetical protein [uncultured Paludibacter sp.]|uniref:Carboxypeptidase-like regulatory domain-containing protein n=1 Tax=uncultured Paludibacter sp. TaxID=497635 RepID=A0A653AFS1_9BACT|nr:conserved exported hypothetical protein [uncultured Paludibacter sp.]
MFAIKQNQKESIKKYFVLLCLLFAVTNMMAANNVLLQKADSAYNSYSGVVIDKKNGEKLPFAHISVVSTNISTVTNSEGEFLLKIPVSLIDGSIEINFIGYETLRVPINSLKEQKNKIGLTQLGFTLPEIDVLPNDALELVKRMLDERSKNYSGEDMLMNAFYREIIRKKNTPISISEAIVDIYKQSYNNYQQDKVSLFRSRKSTDYNKLDTVVFKLMGGPFNTLFIDVIKYPEYFLTWDNLNDYTFEYEGNERIDERLIYVVGFKQNAAIKDPLLYGKLYIDAQTYALAKADFDVNLQQPEVAAMLFIRKKPFNARVFATKAHYLIDYKLTDGKWRYSYSRVDLGLKIDWKKKFFNTYYNSSIEMAATNWKEKVDKSTFKNKTLIRPNVVLFDAISGFSDSDFWGEKNIIEPEKSIENAINKIQKQLKKSSK